MQQYRLAEALHRVDRALIRLSEASSKAVIKARQRKHEVALGAVFSRFFALQGNAVAKALAKYVKGLSEAEEQADFFDQLFDEAVAPVNKAEEPKIQAALEQVLLAGATDVLKDLKVTGISFTLRNPRAVKWAKGSAGNLITQIDETTRNEIKGLITEGLDQGKSYQAIAKEIAKRFSDFAKPPKYGPSHVRSRAELVAITETANAYSAGSFFAVQTASEKTGLAFEKKWLTVGDQRVSEGCKTNEAEGWIDTTTDHSSGHLYPPRFPGCRCSEQYRRKR